MKNTLENPLFRKACIACNDVWHAHKYKEIDDKKTHITWWQPLRQHTFYTSTLSNSRCKLCSSLTKQMATQHQQLEAWWQKEVIRVKTDNKDAASEETESLILLDMLNSYSLCLNSSIITRCELQHEYDWTIIMMCSGNAKNIKWKRVFKAWLMSIWIEVLAAVQCSAVWDFLCSAELTEFKCHFFLGAFSFSCVVLKALILFIILYGLLALSRAQLVIRNPFHNIYLSGDGFINLFTDLSWSGVTVKQPTEVIIYSIL